MADGASAGVLARAEAQKVVYAPRPSRLDVHSLSGFSGGLPLAVRVHRNVAAERLVGLAAPFLAYAGYDLVPAYESYDDSLSFAALGEAAREPDLELVWLDLERLPSLDAAAAADFLTDRIEALRELSGAPIVVLDVPPRDPRAEHVNAALRATARRTPSVHVCPVSDVARALGEDFYSSRGAALTAVPLSAAALMRLAQLLGLCWLPAATGRRVRGIAVDLDNTLYAGVLGEDGIDGLVVGQAHRDLQSALRALHENGFFLAVLSKNDPADVEALFAQRPDLVLRREDVDAWGVGWDSKSAGLEAAAAALRISPDTFLFLDDNPGELLEVAARHPGVFPVHAGDPAEAARALTLAPGLFRFEDAGADTLRVRDLAAEAERQRLREAVRDPMDYLASLGAVVTYAVDDRAHLRRLAELSAKTNQFVTALARLDELALAERMSSPDGRVLSIRLSDRLADSGIVALLAARRLPDGDVLVDDVCMSCRALGRGLEESMLGNALARLGREFGVDRLALAVVEGPRNGPARTWLSTLGGERLGDRLVVDVPAVREDIPVEMVWEAS